VSGEIIRDLEELEEGDPQILEFSLTMQRVEEDEDYDYGRAGNSEDEGRQW
jgi:phage protein U